MSRSWSIGLSALLLCACSAEPPEWRAGQPPAPGAGRFATIATCTPPGVCPGPACAAQAVGAPDGQSVALESCKTLDVSFTGGQVTSRSLDQASQAELVLHLGAPLTGLTRVEASADGLEYTLIGYLATSAGLLPADTKDTCLAETVADKAYLYLTRCNSLTTVSALRLVDDLFVAGAATVDALEALSFEPLTSP